MRWIDPAWYAYLWRRKLSAEARIAAGVVALLLLALGGYFSMAAFAGGGTGKTTNADYVALVTTVDKLVTVEENGKPVIRRVPVIKKVFAKPTTVLKDVTLTAHGRTKVVTKPVTRLVPVVKKKIVRVNGKTKTVSQVVTNVKSVTNVVTNEHTVTNQSTVEHNNTDTVTRTVTNAVTNTVTHTNTVTQPVTVVQQQTVTVTQTVTSPPDTVTVVVTETVPGKH